MINKRSKKDDLINVLKTLKEGRKKLLIDFLNQDPLIFIPIFKYENKPTVMNIAIENYFISWINYHFHIGKKHINSKESKEIFLKTMEKFFCKYLRGANRCGLSSPEFISDLLEKKRRLLHELLDAEDKHDFSFKTLLVEYEKDKVLFQRQINKLKNGGL
nr:hypothetical protein [Fervidobacterium pennivorans]